MISARKIALASIALLVTAAALASSTESYRGLYLWAARHGLPGTWAALFPLQVDVFIVVGELALFVALASQWDKRSRIGAWLVTIAGLAVSTMGNIGHAASGGLTTRVTAAVPPLAAAAALAVGLGVLKRVGRRAAPEDAGAAVHGTPVLDQVHDVPAEANGHDPDLAAFAADLARGEVPTIRRIRSELGCGQPRAQRVRERITALTGGTGA